MAGATLSGWPSMAVARVSIWRWVSGLPSSAFAPSRPATMQAEDEPRPRAIGISLRWVIRRPLSGIPSWSYTARALRNTRLFGPLGIWVPSREEISMRRDSSKVKTLCIERARPSESNPAPTLALVAGTVTVTIVCEFPPFCQSAKTFMARASLPPSKASLARRVSISAGVAACSR